MPKDPLLPYEDLHMTKSILRMELNVLAYAIIQGEPLSLLHSLLKEIDQVTNKLGHREMQLAVHDISYLIDHYYPISESTEWSVISSLGEKFRYIDRQTLY